MKIQIVFFSNKLSSHESLWIDGFSKRIEKFCPFELIQKKDDPKILNSFLETLTSKKESFTVMLDLKGRKMSTEDFSLWLLNQKMSSSKTLTFVVGGSYGFTKEQLSKAHLSLSLSTFTFPHRLALLILTEQIYRVLTLHAGHPYHHG